MPQNTVADAQARYRDGDLQGCRDVVVAGLADRPDDLDLLDLLVTVSLELGDLDESAATLRRVVELRPSDTRARIDLAHVVYTLGHADEAIALLTSAASAGPDHLEALRRLADMHEVAGNPRAALEVAEQLLDVVPDDVPALLHAADLLLAVDDHAEAAAVFRRLLTADDEPGHQVHAHHGLIEAAARVGDWRRVLDHAIEATSVDRHSLTTDLLAYASARLFGPSEERSALPWEELADRLADERAQHRRLHDEELAR